MKMTLGAVVVTASILFGAGAANAGVPDGVRGVKDSLSPLSTQTLKVLLGNHHCWWIRGRRYCRR
jgi:hypothetical protein